MVEEYCCKDTNVLTDSSASKSSKKKGTKKEDDSKAQEAHEAIRPTNVGITKLPEDGDFTVTRERKLYYLNLEKYTRKLYV